MNTETKLSIQMSLEFLRRSLIDQGVSIAVIKDTGELCFFDTDTYLSTGKYDGIKVKPESLVQ